MLDNKFLGLPLVLWLVIVGTALLVDIPVVLLNTTTQHRLGVLQNETLTTQLEVRKLEVVPTASPSATPTLILTPTIPVLLKRSVVVPSKPVTTGVK